MDKSSVGNLIQMFGQQNLASRPSTGPKPMVGQKPTSGWPPSGPQREANKPNNDNANSNEPPWKREMIKREAEKKQAVQTPKTYNKPDSDSAPPNEPKWRRDMRLRAEEKKKATQNGINETDQGKKFGMPAQEINDGPNVPTWKRNDRVENNIPASTTTLPRRINDQWEHTPKPMAISISSQHSNEQRGTAGIGNSNLPPWRRNEPAKNENIENEPKPKPAPTSFLLQQKLSSENSMNSRNILKPQVEEKPKLPSINLKPERFRVPPKPSESPPVSEVSIDKPERKIQRNERSSFVHTAKRNGPPVLKQLPSYVYNKQPPLKPKLPPNVKLPKKDTGTSFGELPPPPPSLSSRPLPPADLLMGDFPAPPPAVSLRPLPPPATLPPRPGFDKPQRDVVPPSGFGGNQQPPPLPSAPRGPPTLPPKPEDDVYDDTEAPPSHIPPAPMEIPTWDDEDDGVIYDETAEEMESKQIGSPIADEPEELYEDVETYQKLKLQASKEAEKRKKENEKKDKEMRKKFKLPKDGEITVESYGYIMVECKGGGKDLPVQVNEKVDIIRMMNNPKGKWLIRNLSGSYGFVDSDKVDVNTDVVKSTLRTFSATRGGSFVNQLPEQPNTDEAIYDETAEDLYDEI